MNATVVHSDNSSTVAFDQKQLFNESSNKLDISYHLLDTELSSNFTIVVTPTKPKCSDHDSLYLRCGQKYGDYCVARGLACDGHINCMLEGRVGRDEEECKADVIVVDG